MQKETLQTNLLTNLPPPPPLAAAQESNVVQQTTSLPASTQQTPQLSAPPPTPTPHMQILTPQQIHQHMLRQVKLDF